MTRPARFAALAVAMRRAARVAKRHAERQPVDLDRWDPNRMLCAFGRMGRLHVALERVALLARQELNR